MTHADPNNPSMPWYKVPEMWLILLLLGSTVIGSFALLAEAINTPDTHIVVPDDVPRPSRSPPTHPATPGASNETKDPGPAP